MDYFAGLDISMDETHICILCSEKLSMFTLVCPINVFTAVLEPDQRIATNSAL
jgi:hypothetical protein